MASALNAPLFNGYIVPLTSWKNTIPNTRNSGCVLFGGTMLFNTRSAVATLFQGISGLLFTSVVYNLFAKSTSAPPEINLKCVAPMGIITVWFGIKAGTDTFNSPVARLISELYSAEKVVLNFPWSLNSNPLSNLASP